MHPRFLMRNEVLVLGRVLSEIVWDLIFVTWRFWTFDNGPMGHRNTVWKG